MSFNSVTCGGCYTTYEFYQIHTLVPACPRCGGNGDKPLTSAEYYRSMGVEINKKEVANAQIGATINT